HCACAPRLSAHDPGHPPDPPSFPTRRSSDLNDLRAGCGVLQRDRTATLGALDFAYRQRSPVGLRCHHARGCCELLRREANDQPRSEEHTSELQSRENLVCRLLLEKKKTYGSY